MWCMWIRTCSNLQSVLSKLQNWEDFLKFSTTVALKLLWGEKMEALSLWELVLIQLFSLTSVRRANGRKPWNYVGLWKNLYFGLALLPFRSRWSSWTQLRLPLQLSSSQRRCPLSARWGRTLRRLWRMRQWLCCWISQMRLNKFMSRTSTISMPLKWISTPIDGIELWNWPGTTKPVLTLL